MKASELITQLQAVIAEKGDVPVLVTGFDSSGMDDIENFETKTVQKIVGGGGHGPLYEDSDYWQFETDVPYNRLDRDGEPFDAIYIG